jgi:hypothetical protein
MPSFDAIEQACCPLEMEFRMFALFSARNVSFCLPPAPPKQERMCFPVEYPLASVSVRMGRHIVSFATVRNLSPANPPSTLRHTTQRQTNKKIVPPGNFIGALVSSSLLVDNFYKLVELRCRSCDVKTLVLFGAKDLWEKVWKQATKEQIGVGSDGIIAFRIPLSTLITKSENSHRKRPAFAIARRARMSTSALRSHYEETVAKEESRPATGSHSVYAIQFISAL